MPESQKGERPALEDLVFFGAGLNATFFLVSVMLLGMRLSAPFFAAYVAVAAFFAFRGIAKLQAVRLPASRS